MYDATWLDAPRVNVRLPAGNVLLTTASECDPVPAIVSTRTLQITQLVEPGILEQPFKLHKIGCLGRKYRFWQFAIPRIAGGPTQCQELISPIWLFSRRAAQAARGRQRSTRVISRAPCCHYCVLRGGGGQRRSVGHGSAGALGDRRRERHTAPGTGARGHSGRKWADRGDRSLQSARQLGTDNLGQAPLQPGQAQQEGADVRGRDRPRCQGTVSGDRRPLSGDRPVGEGTGAGAGGQALATGRGPTPGTPGEGRQGTGARGQALGERGQAAEWRVRHPVFGWCGWPTRERRSSQSGEK